VPDRSDRVARMVLVVMLLLLVSLGSRLVDVSRILVQLR
jgi:hypothetical protein